MQPTNSLRLVIPNNASPSRITAAAGTRLAGTYINSVTFYYNFKILQLN